MLTLQQLFDSSYYLSKNSDVAQAVSSGKFTSAFDHFTRFGQFEGRNPSASFDTQYYLNTNADVQSAVSSGKTTAAQHFINYGQTEGRDPNQTFSTSYYLATNSDVANAVGKGSNPLTAFQHFLQFGQSENRNPSGLFNSSYYLQKYSDVNSAVQNKSISSAYLHYVDFGRQENRQGFNPSQQLTLISSLSDPATAGTYAAVKAYDTNTGQYLGNFVAPGNGLVEPDGITFGGANGNLYVADLSSATATGGQVLQYNGSTGQYQGVFLPNLKSFTASNGTFQISHPSNIVVGPNGDFYVSNFAHYLEAYGVSSTPTSISDGVLEFKQDGTFVRAFTPSPNSNAKFGPVGLAFDASGNLYVAAFIDSSVLEFDSNGNFLKKFVPTGSQGLNEPVGLLSYNGNLYVSDYSGQQLLAFDENSGNFVGKVASAIVGSKNKIDSPTAIAVSPTGQFVVVSDLNPQAALVNIDPTPGNTSVGAFNGYAVAPQAGGLSFPVLGLAFTGNRNLYVKNYGFEAPFINGGPAHFQANDTRTFGGANTPFASVPDWSFYNPTNQSTTTPTTATQHGVGFAVSNPGRLFLPSGPTQGNQLLALFPLLDYTGAPDNTLLNTTQATQATGISSSAVVWGISQTLGDVLRPNNTYTLSVDILNPQDSNPPSGFGLTGFAGYAVQLLAGGTVLAQDINTTPPAEGATTTSTISYTASATGATIGQPLQIRLIDLNQGVGRDVDFDNVRLTTTATA